MHDLETQINALEGEYMKAAGIITKRREKGARQLERRVYSELKELNLPRIKFEVKVERRASIGPTGIDQIDFLFSANPGEELRPLARVASGGEISRVILALKKALAHAYRIPTLIFDEIDVGVGGTALTAMAGKLYELSHHHQVILVTHSPQVAAYAERHFHIEKKSSQNHTIIKLAVLDQDERAEELARMLGGEEYSELTLQHAREMLSRTRNKSQ